MATVAWTDTNPLPDSDWNETDFPVVTAGPVNYPSGSDYNRRGQALYQVQRIPNTRNLAIKYRLQFRIRSNVADQKYFGKARVSLDGEDQSGPSYDSGSTYYGNTSWSTKKTGYAVIEGIKNGVNIPAFFVWTASVVSDEATIPNPITAPQVSINNGGNWVEADAVYIKVNGGWVEADAVHVKENGTWQEA